MDKTQLVFSATCIVALFLSGCTVCSPSSGGLTNTTFPTPVATATAVNNQTCTVEADCVPAQCCHPTSCVNQASVTVCNLFCTASCEGPLDCGEGSCGCSNGRCVVVPAGSASRIPNISLLLTASPLRYAPTMSSTVGIGIEVNASGFDPASAIFTWSATYGKFFSWSPVNFTVQDQGNPVINHGEKLYWSYIEKPSSTHEPVIVFVTAIDPATNKVLGSSTLTLDWEGNSGILVRNAP